MNRKRYFWLILLTFFLSCSLTQAQELKNLSSLQKSPTLENRNISLKEELQEIENRFDVFIFYKSDEIENKYVSSIVASKKNKKIDELLRQVLGPLNMGFRQIAEDSFVVFEEKTPKLKEVIQETVSGKVTDQKTGEPLPGVNISIKETTSGTATNADGFFEVNVPSLQDTLVFSYIGYASREVPINGRTEINISLEVQAISGEELVVVGYGNQEKVNLTGSVTQVEGERLENRVTTSPLEGLGGLIPGLNVSVNNSGGEPGATRSFNIRGIGSLSGGSPLVLVDGVRQDLSTVNPQDIKSVTVLKDAASAAIYGARAPFGVILVTTKDGSRSEGVKISYNYQSGWNAPTLLPEPAPSYKWAEYFNDAHINAGDSQFFSDETIQRMRDYAEDPNSIPVTSEDPARPNEWGTYNIANGNQNWYETFYKDWSLNQNHNLSVTGGDRNTYYYISGGLFDQGGQFEYGDDQFKRYSITSNIHSDVTEWLGVDLNLKYNKRQIDKPYTYWGYYNQIARAKPWISLYDPNGHMWPNYINHQDKGGRDITDRNQFLTGVFFEFKPTKNWNINTDFSYRLNNNSNTSHQKEVTEYLVDETTRPFSETVPTSFERSSSKNRYITANVYSSYQLEFDKHFIKGLAGFQAEELKYSSIWGRKTELISDLVPSISTGIGQIYVGDSEGHWSTMGVFGRLNYNFGEKYLFEFNLRYDGSSRFPEGNNWGVFPSFSLGYNLAKENFWSGIRDKVSMFKIRGSYGSLGNQEVANYLYINTINVRTNLGYIFGDNRPNYALPPELVSSNLTWENAATINFGLDVRMLKDRLSLTFDVFKRTTTDMFGPVVTLPSTLGTSAPVSNNADLETKGFELAIGWDDNIGAVQYHVAARLYDNTTTVTKYNNETGYINDYYNGYEIGDIWGYTTEGLYQTDQAADAGPDQSFFWADWGAGDVEYRDLNGDGIINNGNQTLDDHGDLSIIGNSTPRYRYSIDLGLEWKGFDISTLWNGIGKRDVWLGRGNNNIFWGVNGNNVHSSAFKPHLDYWREDNKDAYFPKPYMSSEDSKNKEVQTRYLQNAAFIRLRNLQVGYTLPNEWLNNFNVSHLRVFFSGENLFFISPISDNFDPEATSGAGASGKLYPIAKTLSLGLNLEF